jgi:hypothetical protein
MLDRENISNLNNLEINPRKMNKDKKADISILLLVLMTLVLAVSVLAMFYSNTSNSGAQIKDSRFLDLVYSNEMKTNFYINEIMDKSIVDIKGDKLKFIENFRNELLKYNVSGEFIVPELSQLEPQLNENNIRLNDGIIFIKFSVKIDKNFNDGAMVSYLYVKEFGRRI